MDSTRPRSGPLDPRSLALVSASAYIEGVPWLTEGMTRPMAIASVLVATLGTGALFKLLDSDRIWTMRLLAGVVATAIITGYFGAVFPVAIERAGGQNLTWHDAAATAATMNALAGALVVAGALILPGLAFLYRLFKTAPARSRP